MVSEAAELNLPPPVREWLESLRRLRHYSRHTEQGYRQDILHFLAFLHGYAEGGAAEDFFALWHSLDLTALRAWLARRKGEGFSAASTARAVSALRSLARYLYKQHGAENTAVLTLKAPKRQAPLPKAVSVPQSLTAAETIGALQKEPWVALRDHALLLLLYGGGLRIGEALGLTRRTLTAGEALTVRGKGNKDRLVPLLPEIRAALHAYAEACPYGSAPDDPLFYGLRGKPLQAAVFQKQIRYLRAAAGLPESATPHAFRHSFATHLLAEGGDLRSIQTLLGHASLSTTQRYTQVDKNRLLSAYRRAHPLETGGA